jgi:serine/threonine-protein kinase HipA
MLLGTSDDPYRLSNVGGCVARAALYGLSNDEALEIVHGQRDTITTAWDELCDEARLTRTQSAAVRRVFPHEYALYELAA